MYNLYPMYVDEMSVGELKTFLDQGTDMQLIDVRETAERQLGYLPLSFHIPFNQLPSQYLLISREKPVIIYCHHGMQSLWAIEYLQANHGFNNLFLLRGGLHTWAIEIDQRVVWY